MGRAIRVCIMTTIILFPVNDFKPRTTPRGRAIQAQIRVEAPESLSDVRAIEYTSVFPEEMRRRACSRDWTIESYTRKGGR